MTRYDSPQPVPRRATASRGGFTLMEMLVSISLTTVLLLLVSRVFNDTSRTIADSMDISQVLATTRVVSDQLFDDGSRIITAKANVTTQPEKAEEPGGFLVIVQQRNAGVFFPEPGNIRPGGVDEWSLDADGDGIPGEYNASSNFDDLIRTDQLVFFRTGDRMESLTPATDDRYDSDARSIYVRIWYGHVSPPIRDGGSIIGVEPGDSRGNNNANVLTLGRQALLILDDVGFSPDTGIQLGKANNATGRLVDAREGEPITDETYRFDTALVQGVADNDFDQLFEGATDVLAIHHPGMNDGTAAGRGWAFKDFFEDNIGQTAILNAENSDGFYSLSPYSVKPTFTGVSVNMTDLDRLPTTEYTRSALAWGFLDNGRRLIATSDIEYPYATEQVGRTHAFFAAHITDFAVEFAADILDDWGEDPANPGELKPVGGLAMGVFRDGKPDETPDTIAQAEADDVAAELVTLGIISLAERDDYADRLFGSIKWYTADHLVNNPIDGGELANYIVGGYTYPDYDPSKPLTWSIPRAGLHSNATAYPPYTGTYGKSGTGITSGGVVGPPGGLIDTSASGPINDRAVFVFGHTADVDYDGGAGAPALGDGTDSNGFEAGSAKWWPYLLRVRYRLHDGDGSFGSTESVSGNQIAGKWFEQIIAVPRK